MNTTFPILAGLASATLMATPAAICQTSVPEAVANAGQLVERVTPKVKGLVRFEQDKAAGSKITISKNGDGISIIASDTRHMVAGYGWYLRNIAKVHFSWNGDRLDMPVPLPAPENPVTVESPWKINFAFNYCTLSYTSAFWDWNRWQREIDFLALNGFTHALVTAGLEKTWQIFLTELKYPKNKIAEFIPNPAYAAWWNMGNLEGFGGPLTQGEIDREAQMGRQIASRMQALGIVPVLQGYVGFIPADFSATVNLKGLKVVDQGQWVGFKRPWVVDPTCEAFPALAEKWYKAVEKVYGSATSAYGGDLFHEGGKKGDINVTEAAKAVQTAMTKASAGSTWVLQSWHSNPSKELLKGTNPENTLILQLTKNMHNGGANLKTFEGMPWVWCELANFGGNTGMYGGIPMLSKLGTSLERYGDKGVVGMGILSEGVETNPLHYEMFFDRMWKKNDFKINEWLEQYAQKRYGAAPEPLVNALELLANSIYSPVRDQEGCTESIVCARPGWNVTKASTWSSGGMYYSIGDIAKAAEGVLNAAKANPELLKQETFNYDFVDVTRQLLADSAYYQLQTIKHAFDQKDTEAYKREVSLFLKMVTEMDALLDTNRQFQLSLWLDRAAAKGKTADEKKLMLESARRLVTTWIDSAPQALNDYSNRQWSGLVKDFYLPRWKMFFEEQLLALDGKKSIDKANKDGQAKIVAHDLAFAKQTKTYPSAPQGNTLEIATRINSMMSPKIPAYLAEQKSSEGMAWDLKQGSPFTFNVTDQITSAGTYTVTFQWKSGSSALIINSVKLYEGDKEVASDTHEGWTGIENKQNTYTLQLPKYRAGLDSYILKADVKGVSGPDSAGKLTIKKIK